MRLISRRRSFLSRLVPLVETGLLISGGLAFYFLVVPEPAIHERRGALPAKETTDVPALATVQPTVVRDHYEFAGGDVFFDDAIEPAFTAVADRAVASLSAVTYTIGRSPAIEALDRAAARGVVVRVVAGRGRFDRKPMFSFVELHPSKGILHEKFLVADEATVFLSSRNLTAGPSKNAAILFHRAPRMAKILAEEFLSLEEMQVVRRCETGCSVEYGTLYFLPGKGCRAAKEAILAAKEGIEAAIYTLTPGTPMMTGLKRSLRAGRRVRVILDDWAGEQGSSVNRRAGAYLESLGALVWYDHLTDTNENPLNFHHKFAVIDGNEALLFGSMNWTKSACYRNREILFISRDHDIVSIFKAYFDDMHRAVSEAKGAD